MTKDITAYIPHREKMVLIDSIKDKNKDHFTVVVNTSSNSLLATKEGIPAYCGIEYMAQSISAYNNIFPMSGVPSEEPRIGFIIAIRKFESKLEYLPLGKTLEIKLEPILVVNNSGSFSCSISIDSEVVSTGKITAYEPSDEELEKFKQD